MKQLVIANWKMMQNLDGLEACLNKAKVDGLRTLIVAPSYPHIPLVLGFGVHVASQDMSRHETGAYTGDVSAQQLTELGVEYVILGHSERRIYKHETDEHVALKVKMTIAHDMIPVICIGEDAEQHKKKQTTKVILAQLAKALKGVKKTSELVIAYEPIWAISGFQKSKKKVSASVHDIYTTHSHIYLWLLDHGFKNAKVVYGGSVTPQNASEILSLTYVDGVLVGSASLDAKSLNSILLA
ncbi:triosephosphate isomerase [Candidatus Falkowbacteria bacterium]|nr:triosephosphate isomerase [Candidatus Falkowbacteria bacterium]